MTTVDTNKNTAPKNYYDALGLKQDTSQDDIDNAYKKLSAEWHPDKHKENRQQAEIRFHYIGEAYNTLKDKDRRAHYDEFAHRNYTDEDADRNYLKFYEQYGTQDEKQRNFIDTNYPNRKRNYYDILGVSRNASDEDIRKAYRKLTMKYNPKINQDTDARRKFNQINQAYQGISNQSKRRSYNDYAFGKYTPFHTQNTFENFWSQRPNEIDENDQTLKSLRNNLQNRGSDNQYRNNNNYDYDRYGNYGGYVGYQNQNTNNQFKDRDLNRSRNFETNDQFRYYRDYDRNKNLDDLGQENRSYGKNYGLGDKNSSYGLSGYIDQNRSNRDLDRNKNFPMGDQNRTYRAPDQNRFYGDYDKNKNYGTNNQYRALGQYGNDQNRTIAYGTNDRNRTFGSNIDQNRAYGDTERYRSSGGYSTYGGYDRNKTYGDQDLNKSRTSASGGYGSTDYDNQNKLITQSNYDRRNDQGISHVDRNRMIADAARFGGNTQSKIGLENQYTTSFANTNEANRTNQGNQYQTPTTQNENLNRIATSAATA